jgi:hypothetical protein
MGCGLRRFWSEWSAAVVAFCEPTSHERDVGHPILGLERGRRLRQYGPGGRSFDCAVAKCATASLRMTIFISG